MPTLLVIYIPFKSHIFSFYHSDASIHNTRNVINISPQGLPYLSERCFLTVDEFDSRLAKNWVTVLHRAELVVSTLSVADFRKT